MLCGFVTTASLFAFEIYNPTEIKTEFAECIEIFKRTQQTLQVMSRQLLAKQTLSHLEVLDVLSRWQKLSN